MGMCNKMIMAAYNMVRGLRGSKACPMYKVEALSDKTPWEYRVEGPHAWGEYYYLAPMFCGANVPEHVGDAEVMHDQAECDKAAKQYLTHTAYLKSALENGASCANQCQYIPLSGVMSEIFEYEDRLENEKDLPF